MKRLALFVIMLSCVAPVAAQPADPALERAATQIQASEIRAHMEFLADDLLEGRDTGSRGHEIAARYVASRFDAIGLRPGGDGGSWFQEIPFVLGRLTSAALEVEVKGKRVPFESGKDFLGSADLNRDRSTVTAPVVYAGFGITAPELAWDDYAGIDARGKIVVVFRNAPPSFPNDLRAHYASSRGKEENAAAHGAIGYIVIQTPDDQKRYPWGLVLKNAGHPSMRWTEADGSPHEASPVIRGRARLSPAGAEKLFALAGMAIDDVYAALSAKRPSSRALGFDATIETTTELEHVTSPNVIGVLEGSDPALRKECVVLVAHLDHVGIGAPVNGDSIYNGAYDNASGVAVMLEVARAMKSMPAAPKRSILFLAVTGEEKGLQGADYFANHNPYRNERTVAAISIDMFLMLYPLRDVVAFGGEHSTLGPLIEKAAAAMNVKLSPDYAPDEVLFVRTDHYPFVKKGIPAAFLDHGLDSGDPAVDGAKLTGEWMRTRYHRPSDDMNQPIDFSAGADFARLNLRIAWAIAQDAERPRWNAGDFFGAKFGKDR